MDIDDLKRRIPALFEQVKRDVRKVLGRQRAGLSLGFVDMGISTQGFVGGMYFSGGTTILMNVRALQVLIDEVMTDPTKPEDIVIHYVYHVLMHEYIHALGFLDERACRDATLHVTAKLFPGEHPVHVMAARGIGAYFPRAIYAPASAATSLPAPGTVELVRGFDRGSTTYFS